MPSAVVKRNIRSTLDSNSAKDSRFLDKVIEFLRTPVKNYKNGIDITTEKNVPSPARLPPSFANEAKILRQFWMRHKNERSFSQLKDVAKFIKIFKELVDSRLCNSVWNKKATPENVLRLFQCLRILLRDQNFQDELYNYDGIAHISKFFKFYTDHHLSTDHDEITTGILKELANTCQKLSTETHRHHQLIINGIHESLVLLLSSNDILILHLAFYALIGLTKSEDGKCAVSELNGIEMIIHILGAYDVTSKHLAVTLLRHLSTNISIREQIKVFHGIPLILSLLRNDMIKLLWNVVWTLIPLAEDSDTSNEIRLLGGIPLLIALLQDKQYGVERSPSDSSSDFSCNTPIEVLSLKSAVCAALTELILNDINAQHVVQANGIFLISVLIFPDKTVTDDEFVCAKCHLQKNAFRTLRFLFSMERNRQLFKRLFLPHLFETFIDVGHYQKELEAYEKLVDQFNSLSSDELFEMKEKVKGINKNKAPSSYIQQYAVYEHLGSGAFGSVYKVKKKGGQTFLAMKEISTYHPEFGKSSNERLANVDGIINECSFVKQQLHHMNIVKYHKAFMEGEKLYIIMDLIDGAPLGEHFNSLKEKCQMFTESRIWNIFIQLLLALRYIHKEKLIVHRDLSPNNIMLGENDHLTITDFGLARQRNPDMSTMTSMVGTILYSCPEILCGLPYGEKADIWAIGCILYQMAMLEPPFYSSNMLSLANKIVEAQYEPLKVDTYSENVAVVIQRCLTVNPEERPDVIKVASLIPDILIKHMEHLRVSSASTEKKLEKAKQRVQKQTEYLKSYQNLCGQALGGSVSENLDSKSQDSEGNFSDREITNSINDSDGNETESPHLNRRYSNGSHYSDDNYEKELVESTHDKHYLTATSSSSSPVRKHKNGNIEDISSSGSMDGSKEIENETTYKSKAPPPSKKRLLPIINTAKLTPRKFSVPNLGTERDVQRTHSCSELDALTHEKIHPKLRPISAHATLSISPRKVREIDDPVLQMLSLVHKIIYISQQPPSLKHNPNRRTIEQFKRSLFSSVSTAVSMKNELKKLMEGSKEFVDVPFSQVGQPSNLDFSSSSGSNHAPGVKYEELKAILETSLLEAGYYHIPLTKRSKPLAPIGQSLRENKKTCCEFDSC